MKVAPALAPISLPSAPPTSVAAMRLDSVDLLRGIVMVLMALDHTRAFFHWSAVHGYGPLDLQTTTVPLYFTRWITHFCAPVFIFLAGTGAFLSTTRGKTKAALSRFLVTRGAWLIVLELTFIHWAGWSFSIDLHVHIAGVIWAIGWSMIALAALIHLPLRAIAGIGVGMIVAHNLLDPVKPEHLGPMAWLWRVLHEGGPVEFAPGYNLFVGYPLVPWIGVMAAGYAFGTLLQRPAEERRRWVMRIGIAATMAFVVVRAINAYGNPSPWTAQSRPGFTLLSFLDCAKYPPSLCYLLMTLGPALIALALLDRGIPKLLRPVIVFGRVPMFYYLLHLPVIHGLAVLIETYRFGSTPWLFGGPWTASASAVPTAGYSLPIVYLAALLALALLYPVCAWFAELKRRRRDVAWLGYF